MIFLRESSLDKQLTLLLLTDTFLIIEPDKIGIWRGVMWKRDELFS